MSDIHRHAPELFDDQEAGVCHHSEPFCERCGGPDFLRGPVVLPSVGDTVNGVRITAVLNGWFDLWDGRCERIADLEFIAGHNHGCRYRLTPASTRKRAS